jgi:hypothetical protein
MKCVSLSTVLQVMMFLRNFKRSIPKLFIGQNQTGNFFRHGEDNIVTDLGSMLEHATLGKYC